VSRISYRVKDLNDGTFLNNDHSDWDPHTFTSFATLEEAKTAAKDWDDCECKIVIVKVTTKPAAIATAHDWAWALRQLHRGRKVRRLDWYPTDAITYDGKGALIWANDYGTPFGTPLAHQLAATDWVLA